MRDVIGWNHYFMNIAEAVKLRSKDPETQVGCVIVDHNKNIISTGYNGFPAGMLETNELWQRPAKYSWVCHAEENAIANATQKLKGSSLFTTMFPCATCCKLIAAAGIIEVYYRDFKYDNQQGRDIFKKCQISLTHIGKR